MKEGVPLLCTGPGDRARRPTGTQNICVGEHRVHQFQGRAQTGAGSETVLRTHLTHQSLPPVTWRERLLLCRGLTATAGSPSELGWG